MSRTTLTTTVIAHDVKHSQSFTMETKYIVDVIARFEWLLPFYGTTYTAVKEEAIADLVKREYYDTDADYEEALEDANSLDYGYEASQLLLALAKANPAITYYDWN